MRIDKKNISKTTHNDLCTGCGICRASCPKNAIQINVQDAVFRPKVDDDMCNSCGRCLRACPGVGVMINENSNALFTSDQIKDNRCIGRFLQCLTGYSNNQKLREEAASGGTLSQFLIWLLEEKYIDGAIVTRFDKDAPLKVNSFIARTREEILSAKGSKYAPVSIHEALDELKNTDGRYVIVGLPCHIHGVRKLMNIDKGMRSKIIGAFSLFCSGSQTFNYTEYILKQHGGNSEDLSYLAYREGNPTGMKATGSNFCFFTEYRNYNMPLKSTFYPRRCLLCVDMFGELADISFGDIHCDDAKEAGDGINAIIVRSDKWLHLLQLASKSGALTLNEITVDRLLYKREMAYVKRKRNSSFISLLHVLHLPTPDYDIASAKVNALTVVRYVVMRLKQFVGSRTYLWSFLPHLK